MLKGSEQSAMEKVKQLKLKITFDDAQSEWLELRIYHCQRRSLSLRLTAKKELEVRAPLNLSTAEIARFVESKSAWLERQLNKPVVEPERIPPAEEAVLKKICAERVADFLTSYEGAKPARVHIRKQKSRWGSYSSSGTLSINLNAALLDDALFEYLMIHELSHIVELNHSPAFWSLVESRIPDYKERKKRLKAIPLKE